MDPASHDIGYLLTAYADGALAPEGAAWVEARLAENPELRARLAEIRRLRAGLLTKLPAAPHGLSEARNDALLAAAARGLRQRERPRRRWILATVIGGVPVAIVGAILLLPLGRVTETLEEEAPPVKVTSIEPPPASALANPTTMRSSRQSDWKNESIGATDVLLEPDQPVSDASGEVAMLDSTRTASDDAGEADPSTYLSIGAGPSANRHEERLRRQVPAPAEPAAPSPVVTFVRRVDELAADAAPGQPLASTVRGKREADVPARSWRLQQPLAEGIAAKNKESRKIVDGKAPVTADREKQLAQLAKPQPQRLLGSDASARSPTTNGKAEVETGGLAYAVPLEERQRTYFLFGTTAASAAAALQHDSDASDRNGSNQAPTDALNLLAEMDAPQSHGDESVADARDGWNEAKPVDGPIAAGEVATRYRQNAPAGEKADQFAVDAAKKTTLLAQKDGRLRMLHEDLEKAGNGLFASAGQLKDLAQRFDDDTRDRALAPLDPQALAERLAQANTLAATGDGESTIRGLGDAAGVPIAFADDAARRAQVRVEGGAVVGRALVAAARGAGLQLRLDAGIPTIGAAMPIDPTRSYGIAPDAFRAAFGTRPMTATAEDAASTFALDQDTASYDQAKAALQAGRAPDAQAIQVEHFVNAMPMDYPAATGPEAFSVFAEAGPSPYASGPLAERTYLLSIGVVAKPAAADERKPLRLTLAVDCSGSMAQAGGLDAVRAGLDELVGHLRADDRVAVVAFADQARVVLPPTPGDQHERIAAALAGLSPNGETNLAEGLDVAYRVAAEALGDGCENRVVVASDGAALDADAATAFALRAQGWRSRGISLVAIGCGAEHSATRALETLADHADGQHWQVASVEQARELFRTRLVPARLQLLAKDAKIQVRFDRERVSHFRLIGYEERRLRHQDFRNDAVDAGELAQDTQTTALYEIVLVDGGAGPLGEAAVRYFDTRREAVRELPCPLPGSLLAPHASPRLELAASAAEFAELLQRGWWSNVRCGTFARLREHLARCPHPAAAQLLALVDRAIALGLKP